MQQVDQISNLKGLRVVMSISHFFGVAQHRQSPVQCGMPRYEGRDKTARFIQFAARFIVGLLARVCCLQVM